MSEKDKKYIIRQDVKGEVSPQSELPFSLLKGKRMILLARQRTFAFAMLVWTSFGAYAYYVYKHKPPKEEVEEVGEVNVSQVQDTVEEKEETQNISLFSPIRVPDNLAVTPENFFDICPSRNPRVVLNTNLERFEVTETYFKHMKEVENIALKNVCKDEEGNYMFDERGYPVVVRNRFLQTIFDARDKTLTFFKSFFRFG